MLLINHGLITLVSHAVKYSKSDIVRNYAKLAVQNWLQQCCSASCGSILEMG